MIVPLDLPSLACAQEQAHLLKSPYIRFLEGRSGSFQGVRMGGIRSAVLMSRGEIPDDLQHRTGRGRVPQFTARNPTTDCNGNDGPTRSARASAAYWYVATTTGIRVMRRPSRRQRLHKFAAKGGIPKRRVLTDPKAKGEPDGRQIPLVRYWS